MRRLTLILSDLYLPQDAVRESALPAAMDLPSFDWLLRFAHAQRIADWRTWLAAALSDSRFTGQSAAQAAAFQVLPAALAKTAWIATPVRLEARLDHVRLSDRGLLRLGVEERSAWRAAFARSFAPDYALHDAGPRGFLLEGISPAAVVTCDPARLLDADISKAVPRGPAAAQLRRLSAEIEMWMHAEPLNQAREHAGAPRISSLWLWGGGLPEAAQPRVTTSAPPARHAAIYGEDPFVAGLARAAPATLRETPAGFAAMADDVDWAVVEVAPMSGSARESLPTLEAQWLAPLRAALARGALAQLDIVANDQWFRVAARPAWRWWRRRRGWLTALKA